MVFGLVLGVWVLACSDPSDSWMLSVYLVMLMLVSWLPPILFGLKLKPLLIFLWFGCSEAHSVSVFAKTLPAQFFGFGASALYSSSRWEFVWSNQCRLTSSPMVSSKRLCSWLL
ncbi:hypothetical protein DY000_02036955 [Brassica cretica]|uniref:Uncharacterized protein n=1 Tax=Brassica cretica TaxID=69181 RepID=A0ABQ7BKQ3_BRACR|nr:hypothetical protein DY000_02036955 [Brassica cretica]